MRRQSSAVIFTLHWDLEEEFSTADMRKLRQHHKYFKVHAENYKEIKQEAENRDCLLLCVKKLSLT